MTHAFKTIATPVGSLKLVASDAALVAVLWENDDPKRVRLGPVMTACQWCLSRSDSRRGLRTKPV
jgi:hypothetical protein